MANLFKPTYTKKDPETGNRSTHRLKKWYAKYRDANGVLQRTPLCEDKVAAQTMLADIVRKVERQIAGVVDPSTANLRKPLTDCFDEYRRHLEVKARSESHIKETMRLVRKVLGNCRCLVLADLQSADGNLEEHLYGRLESGVSHRTINADLVAVRSFCRWLLAKKQIQNDPTIGLEHLNVDEDRRYERRALTDEEATRLIETTFESDRTFRRLTGRDRAVMYMLAQRTGLRRKELYSMTEQAFDFDGDPATVAVRAENAKGRKFDVLPLPKETAIEIREYLNGRDSNGPIWPGSWWRRSAEMLRLDLCDASIEAVDKDGQVIDFHGQRTTYITGLARAGVSPAAAQRLARHSDINLTLGTYTRLNADDLQSAVEKLPALRPRQNGKDDGELRQESLSAADLSRVSLAWPKLSDHVKRAILALVTSDVEEQD